MDISTPGPSIELCFLKNAALLTTVYAFLPNEEYCCF